MSKSTILSRERAERYIARREAKATALYRSTDAIMKQLEDFYSKNLILGPEVGNVVNLIRKQGEEAEEKLIARREEMKVSTAKRIDDDYEGLILARRIQTLREERDALAKTQQWQKKK